MFMNLSHLLLIFRGTLCRTTSASAEKILSVLSSSGSDGKLSTAYHYHCRAIQYGAIIVAGNFLPAEEAEALSLHAMDRANIAMKGLMKWFDEAEEGSNETVVAIVGE